MKQRLTLLSMGLLMALILGCEGREASPVTQNNPPTDEVATEELQPSESVTGGGDSSAKQPVIYSPNEAATYPPPKPRTGEQRQFVEGVHYSRLKIPMAVADNSKIEVIEFFWYGCPHCYSFEPLLMAWKKTLPEDVNFVPIPAVWGAQMDLHAKMYYVSIALGLEDKVHLKIYQAMNEQNKRFTSETQIANFFADYGVNKERFTQLFNSFGINSQVIQGNNKVKASGLTGTPELLINGKYRTGSSMAGSQSRMLAIANFLIEKERKLLK